MRILAADPGGTTGYCIMEFEPDSEAKPNLVEHGQVEGDSFPMFLKDALMEWEIDRVIYERFRIYKGTIGDSAVPVLKQIGQIEFVCQMMDTDFSSQPPANKTFFEKKLQALGMHQPGNDHACDAIAHALFFAMSESQKVAGHTPSWVLLSLKSR
jgi:hypothetical protein